MLATTSSAHKTRTLKLGEIITAFLNNEDDSFKIQDDFIEEMQEFILDLETNEGKREFPLPMEVFEWGKDHIVAREKSALDHFKEQESPSEVLISRLCNLTDKSVSSFVEGLTNTLIEVYQNANPNNPTA